MTNQTNPLVNHFRSPKLYVKLPSGTSLYSEDVIEIPESGEVPIFPMTAKDEIMMKNPDALLNGEATTQLLMSCCPNIKKPLAGTRQSIRDWIARRVLISGCWLCMRVWLFTCSRISQGYC